MRPRGPVLAERRSLVGYSGLRGELLETVIPVLGHMQARLGGGAGRPFGRFTVSYPDTPPLDQYATPVPASHR